MNINRESKEISGQQMLSAMGVQNGKIHSDRDNSTYSPSSQSVVIWI